MTTSPRLGAAYDPLGAHLADPFPFYAQARASEPVFFSPVLNAWVVTRHADVREVLRQPAAFSSANSIPMVVPPMPAAVAELERGYPPTPVPTNSDGEAHQRLRGPFAQAFSPEAVAAAEGFIQERADALVDGFAGPAGAAGGGGGRADLMDAYATRLPVEVITWFCGLRPEDAEVVRAGSAGIVALVAVPMSEEEQAEAARRFVALQHLAGAAVRERRERPTGDVVTRLIDALAPGDGPLTFEQEAELVNNLLELLVPGNITTGPLLGNGLRALLADQDQWRLLVAEPDRIPGAVEEIARHGTPMSGQFRITTREVTLGGVTLPEGTPVALLFDAANRDTGEFPEGDRFDLNRPPGRHLTFGFGTHYCVGAGLARKEVEVTLRTLTRRLPTLRLDPERPASIAPIYSLRGPAELPVVW